MPKSAYWKKMCLLTENVIINRKGACQKVFIKMSQPFILDKVHIEWKCTYWSKMCLLNENVPINWKCVYWSKSCLSKCVYWKVITLHIKYTLLNENVFNDRKGVYWKMKNHYCSVFLNVYMILIYVAI